MYALKARDKYYKREKEREEEGREDRRVRAREQHTHHRSEVTLGGCHGDQFGVYSSDDCLCERESVCVCVCVLREV